MRYGLAGVTSLKNRSGLIRGEIVRDTFALVFGEKFLKGSHS